MLTLLPHVPGGPHAVDERLDLSDPSPCLGDRVGQVGHLGFLNKA